MLSVILAGKNAWRSQPSDTCRIRMSHSEILRQKIIELRLYMIDNNQSILILLRVVSSPIYQISEEKFTLKKKSSLLFLSYSFTSLKIKSRK